MASELEQIFANNWELYYPQIDLYSEYRFAPPRRFRFDFAHIDSKVAAEVQGGIFSNGRHSRGSGLVKEHVKLNLAAANGWRVFFLSVANINDLQVYHAIAASINDKKV